MSSASPNGKEDHVEQSECFVIMPISDPDGYEAGHFQRVYEDLFVPACERAGYRAVRADQVRQTNLIHLDVLQKIIDSPMALCDLSSRNPNVLFELGLRQAFDKPVVLVQEVGTAPIFDINPLRYTDYHREMLYRHVIEDQAKIAAAIMATKEDIGNKKSVNSIVKLLALTSPASLTSVPEGDKDTALLQVIMKELSTIRSEIRDYKQMSEEGPLARGANSRPARKGPSRAELAEKSSPVRVFLETRGLISYLEYIGKFPPDAIMAAMNGAAYSRDFLDALFSASLNEEQRAALLALLSVPSVDLERAFNAAKLGLKSY
ncbi:MAG: hypothetical protein M3362_18245 [Acidobacteriota bacterium]|nr:hypothetical protein [Acidobacteriota bacterium]